MASHDQAAWSAHGAFPLVESFGEWLAGHFANEGRTAAGRFLVLTCPYFLYQGL